MKSVLNCNTCDVVNLKSYTSHKSLISFVSPIILEVLTNFAMIIKILSLVVLIMKINIKLSSSSSPPIVWKMIAFMNLCIVVSKCGC